MSFTVGTIVLAALATLVYFAHRALQLRQDRLGREARDRQRRDSKAAADRKAIGALVRGLGAGASGGGETADGATSAGERPRLSRQPAHGFDPDLPPR